MESPKGNRSADNPARPDRPDRPTAILCYGGNRPARPLAFDLDTVARFRRFLRLAATPTGRAELRSEPEWASYLDLDTLSRYVESREGGPAGG
jgi:hypothetical protein